MQTGYGLALLLGVLIGGAMLLDDVITPKRKDPPPRVAMFHHGYRFDIRRLCPDQVITTFGSSRAKTPSRLRFTKKSESS